MDYDIQMKKNTDGEWENLYPFTFARNVVTADDQPLDEFLKDHVTDYEGFKLSTGKKQETIEKELTKHVSKRHFNASSFTSLQEAIFEAENGELTISEGTYLIDKPLKIRSNTKIFAYGVVFKRNANIDNMFINDSNGYKGGYTAHRNIHIYGATFDGSGGQFSNKSTLVAFGHAENIKIIDCIFRNLVDWHLLELNSVRHVLVENCFFENYGNDAIGTEMVQIDLAKDTSQFPWFGPYDNTVCDDITVRNCRFTDGVRGVGSHSETIGKEHTRITIEYNEFRNMIGEAVYGYNWAFTKIHDNHMSDVQKGIHLRVSSKDVFNHRITDNYMSGKNNEDSRGIQVNGVQGGFGINAGTITGNRVKRFGGHGIGVDWSEIWTINNNDVSRCGKTGIILFGAFHSTVSDNISLENNVLAGLDYQDINLNTTTSKGVVHDNICGVLKVNSEVFEVLVYSNVVKDVLTVQNTRNKSFNNMVKGVFVQ